MEHSDPLDQRYSYYVYSPSCSARSRVASTNAIHTPALRLGARCTVVRCCASLRQHSADRYPVETREKIRTAIAFVLSQMSIFLISSVFITQSFWYKVDMLFWIFTCTRKLSTFHCELVRALKHSNLKFSTKQSSILILSRLKYIFITLKLTNRMNFYLFFF